MKEELDIKFGFELFDSFYGMCFILDTEGNIVRSNKSAENYLQKKAEELNQICFFDIFSENDKQEIKNCFIKSLNENKSNNLSTYLKIENKTWNFNLLFSPCCFNGKNRPQFCFTNARDITEKKQLEKDLLQFYSIAENTVNPLQVTDLDGKMIYVNPAFVKISGYKKEELLGSDPKIFGSKKHSKSFWENMWKTISKGNVWSGEIENKKKNGDPFYTYLLISPILDNNGKVTSYFGIHRDITEKKMLEKQLIHTQKMESMGTLAAGVAHEVGNPLASISALVQVVIRSTSDDFAKEKLSLVRNQISRISKIIRDLVDFSRPSTYKLQLTDINKQLVEAVDIIEVGTKNKNIEFKIELDENIPKLYLVADQIQQVFINILLNAVDSILDDKNLSKPKQIWVRSSINENMVNIELEDTGHGIPEENIEKIFEPFYTTKEEGRGTGLGLWVSYGILKSLQGDLMVDSVNGKGTKFTIKLPIQS